MSAAHKFKILNLSGELPKEVKEYFESRNMITIDPTQDSQSYDWSHIIARGDHQFSLLAQTYQTKQKDIKLISIGDVESERIFLESNGKIIVNEAWTKSPIFHSVMDKFFDFTDDQKDLVFEKAHSFVSSTPYQLGEEIDRLIYFVHQQGGLGLVVRSYLDQLLIFLEVLKHKKKIEYPLKISYGYLENMVSLQVYLSATDVFLEDFTSSLNQWDSGNPAKSSLDRALKHTSFLDVTYLVRTQKILLTSFWLENVDQNVGLSFSSLVHGQFNLNIMNSANDMEVLTNQNFDPNVEMTSVLGGNDEVKSITTLPPMDIFETVIERVSEEVSNDEIRKMIKGEFEDQDVQSEIVGSLVDNDDITKKINGANESDQSLQVLAGHTEEKDKFSQSFATEKIDEVIQKVSGKIEDVVENQLVKGEKFKIDDFVQKISSTLTEDLDDKHKWMIKSFPEELKEKLTVFARSKSKKPEELDRFEIKSFQEKNVPMMLKSMLGQVPPTPSYLTSSGNMNISLDSAKNFKSQFIKTSLSLVKEKYSEEELESLSNEQVKELFKDTLKNVMSQNQDSFMLNGKLEEEKLSQTLSHTFSIEQPVVEEIIRIKEKTAIEPIGSTPLFSQTSGSEILNSVFENENNQLKKKIEFYENEVQVLKTQLHQIKEINHSTISDNKKELLDFQKMAEEELKQKDEILRKIQENQTLSAEDQLKLVELEEKHRQLLTQSKEIQSELKKVQIESRQKESLYQRELEKIDRQLSLKDRVAEKAKETLNRFMEKRNIEKSEMQHRLDQVTKEALDKQGLLESVKLKDAERKNTSLTKLVDLYKSQLNSVQEKLANQKSEVHSTTSSANTGDDLRKLQIQNNQLQTQSQRLEKEVKKYQQRAQEESKKVGELKTELRTIQGQYRDIERKHTQLEQQLRSGAQDDDSKIKKIEDRYQAQLSTAQTKIKDLERLLLETKQVAREQVSSDDSVYKTKAGQLETSVKRLTQELTLAKNQATEAKRDAQKFRTESVSLKNQLDKIKKDFEKINGKKAS